MNMDTMGGRKFVLTAAVGLATVLLAWFSKIDDGIYATVILGTVGCYITGNVAVKKVAPAPSPNKSKPK